MFRKLIKHRPAAIAVGICALLLVGSLTAGAMGASPLRIAKKALRVSNSANKRSKSAKKTASSAKTIAGSANNKASQALTQSGQAVTASQTAGKNAGPVSLLESAGAAIPAGAGSFQEDFAPCPAGTVPAGGGPFVVDSTGDFVLNGIVVTESAPFQDQDGNFLWAGAVENRTAASDLQLLVRVTCITPASLAAARKSIPKRRIPGR